MAHFVKTKTLVNPGKRKGKRRLTLAQKLHFGSKRQRVAAKLALSNKRHKKRTNPPSIKRRVTKGSYKRRRHTRRISNVGEILTVSIPGINPGKRKGSKTMARRHSKAKLIRKGTYRRRRRSVVNPYRARRRRRSVVNRGHRRRTRRNPSVVRTRTVYRNRGRRRTHRNPSRVGGSGTVMKIVGTIGGAVVTGMVTKMLPSSLSTGVIGYITTAIVAVAQGKVAGKVFKSTALGNNMVFGGFFMLALRVIGDMFPSLSPYIPFSLSGGRGMGLIANTQGFAVPLVPRNGSMGTYITPGFVSAAIPAPTTGMSGVQNMQGGSLLSGRRSGRSN